MWLVKNSYMELDDDIFEKLARSSPKECKKLVRKNVKRILKNPTLEYKR